MEEVQTIVINRSVEDVFGFIEDFENDVQWREELLRIQRQPDFPKDVGAHYTEEVHWEGRTLQVDLDITKVEVLRRIEFEGRDAGVTGNASFEFEPLSEDTTKLTATVHLDTVGPLNVLEPFMRALVTRQVTHDLERLQTLLESHQERRPGVVTRSGSERGH